MTHITMRGGASATAPASVTIVDPMDPLPTSGLLLITDRRLAAPRPIEDVVAAAFAAGCRWVSLREKDLTHAERTALLRRLVTLGRAYGAAVTVHDDVEAALATNAAGVHLPAGGSSAAARRRLGPSALIGVSTHDLTEAREAAADGADYVTFGPVFASLSKPGYGADETAAGIDRLREATAALPVPVAALGGVTAASARRCLEAGAAAVAVIGAIVAAADPAAATAALLAALRPETGRS